MPPVVECPSPPTKNIQNNSDESNINLLDLAAACIACTEGAARVIKDIAIESASISTTTSVENNDDNQNINLQRPQQIKLNTRTKDDGSLVTNADYAAQRIIVNAIRNISPYIHIICEEDDDKFNNSNNNDVTTTRYEESFHSYNNKMILYKAQQEIRLRYHRITNIQPMPLAPQQLQQHQQNDDDEIVDGSNCDKNETYIHHDDNDDTTSTRTTKHMVQSGESLFNLPYGDDPEECNISASRVSVIIDPLDGTKSYTQGDYDVVTILTSIIVDNIPVFGVIGKPFGYNNDDIVNNTCDVTSILDQSCVIIYGGSLIKSVYIAGGREIIASRTVSTVTTNDGENVNEGDTDYNDLPRAVISSSRSTGIVQDFCTHLAEQHKLIHKEPMYVSGAGEKSLRLIVPRNHEALWFYPKRGTSIWDVAASDAILRTLGGKLTDKYGNHIDYSVISRHSSNNSNAAATTENMNGIIACIDKTLHTKCIELYRQGDWDNRVYD